LEASFSLVTQLWVLAELDSHGFSPRVNKKGSSGLVRHPPKGQSGHARQGSRTIGVEWGDVRTHRLLAVSD
jgi:hypothetical protein